VKEVEMIRVLLLTAVVFSSVPCPMAADDGALVLGSVEAVYHEGMVTFTVLHPGAVSASVRVYDLDTDGLIYNSGPRARTRVTWPAGYDAGGSYRYLVTAWNAAGEVVVSQAAVNTSMTPIAEISFDTVPGDTRMVGPDEIDLLADVNVGSIPGVRLYQDWNGNGGGIELYDEGGFFRTAYMLPSGSTTGGQVRVQGPSGAAWMQGEHPLHGYEAALGVFGTSDFYVWAGETGDDSVQMPDDAVSAAEIVNETGVAAVVQTSALALPYTGATTVASAQITAPTDGFVFATGFATVRLNHTNGSITVCYCSISLTTNAGYPDGLVETKLSSLLPSDTYYFPVSVSRVIPVSAGPTDVYLVCADGGGIGDIEVRRRHLQLLFVPTAYGTVSN
jgi:hypothetical protein